MTTWSLAMPEGPLAAVGWAYLLSNALRVFTYVPQIVTVWRCEDGARSLSLLTWWSWVVSNVATTAYGLLVLRDLPFLMIALLNLGGCGTVAMIAMHRRAQWRRRACV
jgi:uncharacterized protein with PQ loop repeat